jgi:hypothetical protein
MLYIALVLQCFFVFFSQLLALQARGTHKMCAEYPDIAQILQVHYFWFLVCFEYILPFKDLF